MTQPEYIEIEEIGCKIGILQQDISKLLDLCDEIQSCKDNLLKDKKCVKCEEQAKKYMESMCIFVCDEYPLCKCKQLSIIKNEIYNN